MKRYWLAIKEIYKLNIGEPTWSFLQTGISRVAVKQSENDANEAVDNDGNKNKNCSRLIQPRHYTLHDTHNSSIYLIWNHTKNTD